MPDQNRIRNMMDNHPRRVNIFIDLLVVLVRDRMRRNGDLKQNDEGYIEMVSTTLLSSLLTDKMTSDIVFDLMIRAEKIIDKVEAGKQADVVHGSEVLMLRVDEFVNEIWPDKEEPLSKMMLN